jgi:hypothetical protein
MHAPEGLGGGRDGEATAAPFLPASALLGACICAAPFLLLLPLAELLPGALRPAAAAQSCSYSALEVGTTPAALQRSAPKHKTAPVGQVLVLASSHSKRCACTAAGV